jgi:protein gp37
MAENSSIEWTETTWNPVTGCTKVSLGCDNCYAERMARRLKAMGVDNYRNGFECTMHEHMLEIPLTWSSPRTVFVNSMSDLFHQDVTKDFIFDVFGVMNLASTHQFQVLTKRPGRVKALNDRLHWAPNIWMGVSVETEEFMFRIDRLRQCGAQVKFLSLEPLLGPLPNLNLKGIDWVIVGGESGPGARPMEKGWVLDIHDQCKEQGVPFFFKQWGGVNKKKTGRRLQGKVYNEMPHVHLSA